MILHLVPNLCPEADLRDQMSDGEFWEHIFNGHQESVEPDWDGMGSFEEPDVEEICTICGSNSACGFDTDGRAWIHVEEKETQ